MPKKIVLWKAVAFTGISLLFVGIGAFGLMMTDSAARLGHYANAFLVAIGIGMILACVALVGWATQLGGKGRATLGMQTIMGAIASCVLGFLMGGTNVHGPFFLFFLPMIPIFAVGLILLVMAAASSSA